MKGLNSNEKQLLLIHKPASNGGGGGGGASGGGGGGGAGSAPASPLALLGGPNHRLWLVVFLSFFTVASLLTLLSTARDPLLLPPPSSPTATISISTSTPPEPTTATATATAAGAGGLAEQVFDALVHYAAAANASARSMTERDMRTVAGVLRRRGPCNMLVFGLGPETPLWRALNHGGRTVFLDENEYYIAHLEGRLPGLEAYDVSYTTRVADLPDLLAAARAARSADCRPVQDLLFSDCRLALNDLPNHLYDVSWDVFLVDGPRGYSGPAPGRMAPIFTAAVMARTHPPSGAVDVLVHDYDREAERLSSEEFLCRRNLVADTPTLAHFVLRPDPTAAAAAAAHEFCPNATAAAAAAAHEFCPNATTTVPMEQQ